LKQTGSNSFKRAFAEGSSGPHPDADVLAAFAESALLPAERETVLAHLACCAECREVLGMAYGGAEEPREMKLFLLGRERRRIWRVVIPSLAAAAAILVVSSAVVLQWMKAPKPNPVVATRHMEESPVRPAPAQPSQPVKQKHEARRAAPSPVASVPETVPSPAMAVRSQGKGPEAPTAFARRSMESEKMETGIPASVSAFANTATSKALARAPAASLARPHWRINEQGQPERAFGQGAWHPVLPNDSARMEVLAVYGGEVWVGGEKTQVFHSFDDGVSWRVVPLPEKLGSTHTIAHIRFESAQEITIEAADGATWTSTDGGESWK
jgi:hypothetical protein